MLTVEQIVSTQKVFFRAAQIAGKLPHALPPWQQASPLHPAAHCTGSHRGRTNKPGCRGTPGTARKCNANPRAWTVHAGAPLSGTGAEPEVTDGENRPPNRTVENRSLAMRQAKRKRCSVPTLRG